jgi:hypothetical protein
MDGGLIPRHWGTRSSAGPVHAIWLVLRRLQDWGTSATIISALWHCNTSANQKNRPTDGASDKGEDGRKEQKADTARNDS